MAPSSDAVENSSEGAASVDRSEPVAAEREKLENRLPGKRLSDRSEIYSRIKRVDPGLARNYRQLDGQ